MEYAVKETMIGHGDDVLQLFDAVAASDVGRHRQTEALVRGSEVVDRQLVIDECALVIDDDQLPQPVRHCARMVLEAIGVDPEGPIRRLDAGQPTLDRLLRADRRQQVLDGSQERASQAATAAIDAATRRLKKARSWLDSRRGGSSSEPFD